MNAYPGPEANQTGRTRADAISRVEGLDQAIDREVSRYAVSVRQLHERHAVQQADLGPNVTQQQLQQLQVRFEARLANRLDAHQRRLDTLAAERERAQAEVDRLLLMFREQAEQYWQREGVEPPADWHSAVS